MSAEIKINTSIEEFSFRAPAWNCNQPRRDLGSQKWDHLGNKIFFCLKGANQWFGRGKEWDKGSLSHFFSFWSSSAVQDGGKGFVSAAG